MAERALAAVEHALTLLAYAPFSCRKALLQNNSRWRELLIPFGHSGHVALCEIDDERTVAAVRHQRAKKTTIDAMKVEFNALEARIIGCLIEKQITTPDQYPLSLNALVSACNQKSNREPVMELDELTVQRTVDELTRKHLLLDRSGFGSRVAKYRHCFCNTEFGTLKFDPQELAIVCELLVRGPQTPGELRGRASRMASFTDVSEVEAVLERLSKREGGPYVTRLAREPGRRESRYAQLFGGETAEHADTNPVQAQFAAPGGTPVTERSFAASGQEQRLTRLEKEVEALRAELNDLRARLGG